jgi:hypothetical protein
MGQEHLSIIPETLLVDRSTSNTSGSVGGAGVGVGFTECLLDEAGHNLALPVLFRLPRHLTLKARSLEGRWSSAPCCIDHGRRSRSGYGWKVPGCWAMDQQSRSGAIIPRPERYVPLRSC